MAEWEVWIIIIKKILIISTNEVVKEGAFKSSLVCQSCYS